MATRNKQQGKRSDEMGEEVGDNHVSSTEQKMYWPQRSEHRQAQARRGEDEVKVKVGVRCETGFGTDALIITTRHGQASTGRAERNASKRQEN